MDELKENNYHALSFVKACMIGKMQALISVLSYHKIHRFCTIAKAMGECP